MKIKSTFLHQMGHGYLTLGPELLEMGIGSGIILSPKDLPYSKAPDFVQKLKLSNNKTPLILFDPQFYFPRFPQKLIKKKRRTSKRKIEPLYPYQSNDYQTTDFQTNSSSRANVLEDLIQVQLELEVDIHLTPAIYGRIYTEKLLEFNIQLCLEYMELSEEKNVFLSLPLHIDSLSSDTEHFNEILNHLIVHDEISGIYLCVELDEHSKFLWRDRNQLYQIAKFIHFLKKNNKEIILGYSSPAVTVLFSTKLNYFASGHYYNLRSFESSRWTMDESIKRAADKYFSFRLLTALDRDNDLDFLYEREKTTDFPYLDSVRSPSPFDDNLLGDRKPSLVPEWRRNNWRHYLYYCQIISDMYNNKSIEERIKISTDLFDSVTQNFQELKLKGINFHRPENDGTHAQSWKAVVEAFNHDILSEG